ncbi:glycoside hydrolase family 31 protein [Penaeicola halotolerans]|uniref:glycoside hydrolase family 31 protein n=1 Tax=Penaeicola halotolerans TaxID=2793196 RepID=UPI001CF8E6F8|nr:glycoside hydrolase family 31 protein [Penaeicola halotolerans]
MTTITKTIPKDGDHIAVGGLIHFDTLPHGIIGTTENCQFSISLYASSIFRIRISRKDTFDQNPYAVVVSPTDDLFELQETSDKLILSTDTIDLHVSKYPVRFSFYTKDGQLINQDDPAFGTSWQGTEVSTYKSLQAGERFIGLGEKTGNLDRAGKAYTNWNTDFFAYGVDADPLYLSIPFYIGIHSGLSYGIFFDNTHKSIFNFGASNRRFSYFSAEDGDMDYYFIHEAEVKDIISAYTYLTGKIELPPKWALGYQQCRYSYYPDSEVLNVARTFRDKDLPADVIYLDIHHMEGYKVFTFDEQRFPNPKKLTEKLAEMGFKVAVIVDPGVKVQNGYAPYEEGKAKDLFVKYPDGEDYEAEVWPGWCNLPDFTKAETRDWWSEWMKFYTDRGIRGFWNDMNEPASWGQHTPNLIEFDFDGQKTSHRKARNIYGQNMVKSTVEGAKKHLNERPLMLTRSGYAGIQRYTAVWTGDNVASDEHMLAGIRLLNSMGLSGIPFTGYDVGGFCGHASPSLFARWMSIATFSPFFRGHSMINSPDSEPWAFGEEVEEISRNYLKLRYKLIPYIYSTLYESSQNGLPVVRSLAITDTHDAKVYDPAYQNQYLFGHGILVAPVESTKEITKVYLPKGEWYYLFNDQAYKGSQEAYVDCPISHLPVFVKGSSIIPIQSDVKHLDEKPSETLELHLYQGSQTNEFVLYEDDGTSYDFKKGAFHKRTLRYDSANSQLVFKPSLGDMDTHFKEVKLYLHGFDLDSVRVNDIRVNVQKVNYAFIQQISQFDPLPENTNLHHEIKGLPCITFKLVDEQITIKF